MQSIDNESSGDPTNLVVVMGLEALSGGHPTLEDLRGVVFAWAPNPRSQLHLDAITT